MPARAWQGSCQPGTEHGDPELSLLAAKKSNSNLLILEGLEVAAELQRQKQHLKVSQQHRQAAGSSSPRSTRLQQQALCLTACALQCLCHCPGGQERSAEG